LFERRAVHKTYLALAPVRDHLTFPLEVHNHIRKERGVLRAEVVPGAPVNAQTRIELVGRADGYGVYRLTPTTGRTHQLRVHLAGLGIPIVNDPLYPEVLDVAIDDFSSPLQLLASALAFTDPVDGTERSFTSARTLPLAEHV
jgi:tRNA pseudouridine32 synthase/23S rRNA pseudouridine746 synthase